MNHTKNLEVTSIDVRGCARCGEMHERLPVRHFIRPVEGGEGPEAELFTHWGTCPKTAEPILVGCEAR